MEIIYGPKGTGKTERIIYMANETLKTAKGLVVFVTDTTRYSLELKREIRLLDTNEYGINSVDGLCGFIKGLVASNGDNEYVFIDGIARISKAPLSELGEVFNAIAELEQQFGIKFVLTVSAAKEDLPDFVLKYVD